MTTSRLSVAPRGRAARGCAARGTRAALAGAAVAALLPAVAPARARAQERAAPASERPARDTLVAGASLPAEVARTAADVWNAPGTRRASGNLVLAATDTVSGDLAVLAGTATIAGRVAGRVVVINGDLRLQPGARIDGDVLVIGGVLDGRDLGQIGGELRVYRSPLTFHRDGERIVPDDLDDERPSAYIGWRRGTERERSDIGLKVATGQGYNRVEGLPVLFGPTFTVRTGDVRLRVEALGIWRTVGGFSPDARDRGHDARAELRVGRRAHVRFGGRLYDEIAPVEEWQLGSLETGLASVLFTRDYRDYWNRHGGTVWTALHVGPDVSLTASLAYQRWRSAATRDPFSLFDNDRAWRANPTADEGRLHVANFTLHVDTRNDVATPWAGWYLLADYERGAGDVASFGALSSDPNPLADPFPGAPPLPGARDRTPGRREYGRGFLDVRRYNRLSPDAQLNLRVVAGGWVDGDPLPVQRRFSVTGPGAMPGFDFRIPVGRGADVGTCALPGLAAPGAPAQCDRMMLTQVEFRHDIRVRLLGDDGGRPRLRSFRRTASWVLFADAGRGWLVGPRRSGELVYARGDVPSLGSWLADVGAGIDIGHGRATGDVGAIGLYVAKAVSSPSQPLNFLVRVRRRF